MIRTEEILSTIRMFQEENLDVRCATMGINLSDCATRSADHTGRKVREKILQKAGRLVAVCEDIGRKYGIPIINKRIAISPVSQLLEGMGREAFMEIARVCDAAAAEVKVDLLGGFTALAQRGLTPGERVLIESLPDVLSGTERICASVNVASTQAGINVDAILLVAEQIKAVAEATRAQQGFGAAKLVVFANIPPNNPFMAGAYLGAGEPECVINIGVSGPGVVKRAIERLIEARPDVGLHGIAEEIKIQSFRVTRIGELIGREVSERLKVEFGIVDLSLAPTPRVGDSIGEIFHAMGIRKIGEPGTTLAVAMLNDAIKKGGLFASSSVGGLSGAFIPVSEDSALAAAAADGSLTIEKLEAMTSVCSVGLDMVLVPGATSAATLASVIADEMAIGVINNKTTACRIIPVPGKKTGQKVSWGGLFGESVVMPLRNVDKDSHFVTRGGRVPAPLHSLKN
ncbi:MAG: PFL family protein [Candidatus Sumerlaeota bacterium]|nr:PFL family protein [Candidatus Sumerlaeota bacterium]